MVQQPLCHLNQTNTTFHNLQHKKIKKLRIIILLKVAKRREPPKNHNLPIETTLKLKMKHKPDYLKVHNDATLT